jgi:hypothetical protein
VQQVSANEGGRAIVGNLTQDVTGSTSQKSAACPLALTEFPTTITCADHGGATQGRVRSGAPQAEKQWASSDEEQNVWVVMNTCRNPPSTPARRQLVKPDVPHY